MGRFFEEIGRPLSFEDARMTQAGEALDQFVRVAHKYSYWLATREQNAAVGIVTP